MCGARSSFGGRCIVGLPEFSDDPEQLFADGAFPLPEESGNLPRGESCCKAEREQLLLFRRQLTPELLQEEPIIKVFVAQ